MSKRILVIEDEADFRATLREILISAGYEVDVSPYLASAVGEALSGRYDLITLDLRMPELDGMGIAQLFRRRKLDTPILVISGYLNQSITRQLEEMNIRHILPKPSDISEMLDAVENALAR